MKKAIEIPVEVKSGQRKEPCKRSRRFILKATALPIALGVLSLVPYKQARAETDWAEFVYQLRMLFKDVEGWFVDELKCTSENENGVPTCTECIDTAPSIPTSEPEVAEDVCPAGAINRR